MKTILLGLALIGALALPASFASAQTTGISAPSPDDNVTVCKKVDPPTGSHLPQPPICHTKAEWKQMQSTGANDLQEMQLKGTLGCCNK